MQALNWSGEEVALVEVLSSDTVLMGQQIETQIGAREQQLEILSRGQRMEYSLVVFTFNGHSEIEISPCLLNRRFCFSLYLSFNLQAHCNSEMTTMNIVLQITAIKKK